MKSAGISVSYNTQLCSTPTVNLFYLVLTDLPLPDLPLPDLPLQDLLLPDLLPDLPLQDLLLPDLLLPDLLLLSNISDHTKLISCSWSAGQGA